MPVDIDDNNDLDDVLDQNDDQQQQQQQVDPGRQTAPPNDDLRSALTELAGHVKAISTPKEPKQELSPEEEEKRWGVYKPTRKDFFHKFFNLGEDADEMTLKERQELFAEVQQGLVRQSLTGTVNLLKQMREQIESEYAPLREYVSQARAKETRSAFNTAYPTLADARYDKVLKIVASDLAKREFKSQDEFFKALAEGAAESIKEFVPDFDLGAVQPNQPKKAAGSTPRLPRTSVGGSGGAGGGGGQAAAANKRDQSDSIFD